MNTEIYLESFPLDISADLSAMLNFAIDDVKDFSARSTTWSKTIVLPGTANNNKLFGHIFDIGQSNEYDSALINVGYNFNASKSARCIIFQDHIQTFKGVLRLLQINLTNGSIDYEVAVFGEMFGLNVKLSNGLLEDLDFSAYDAGWDETNIVASWDNPGGSGIYYPVMDYGVVSGTTKHDWDIRNIRPACYVKEYIDKMFEAAGYRYECALFNTARFKSLIIPHNQKTLTTVSSVLLSASRSNSAHVLDSASAPYVRIEFTTVISAVFTATNSNGTFTYNSATSQSINFTASASGNMKRELNGFSLEVRKNGVLVPGTQVNYGANGNTSAFPYSYNAAFTDTVNLNDYYEIWASWLSIVFNDDYMTVNPAGIGANSVTAGVIPATVGSVIPINDTIPKNVRQVDFLLSIVKLFNLYVYEDRFDENLILIKPYIDFYSTDSSDAVDWTYKLNRDKAIKIKPMSELNAKKYEFKFKPDTDYYNDLYKKRYGQGYGDYIFDSEYEFAEQIKSFQLIFSATPLVGYVGEEKVYPTIFKKSGTVEEAIDSNIRILQTKKITGVASWDILDGASVLDSVTNYGYAGSFDDPDAPANDLNFGALNELFFTLTGGALNVTQFNVYWSALLAEITDKDSKLLTARFRLTPKDILELDFSKYVHVDGSLFRLNAIRDYNAAIPDDCEVQLLKVTNTIY